MSGRRIVTLGRFEKVETLEPGLNFAIPERVERLVPRAMVWINDGGDEDVKRARAFVAEENPYSADENWRVFELPLSEDDPIGATKRLLEEGETR